MHARIDQLLSLRDGEPVDATVRAHVQHCAHCAAESTRLAQTRACLQTLPQFEPPAQMWDDIVARADAPAPRRWPARVAAVAAIAIVGVVATLAVRDTSLTDNVDRLRAAPSELQPKPDDQLAKLMAQSRELDTMLEYLPQRPSVQRVSLAATVDSIEQRIQWLDWQLVSETDGALNTHQTERLWTERVALMDSLVKVRYAESAPMVF